MHKKLKLIVGIYLFVIIQYQRKENCSSILVENQMKCYEIFITKLSLNFQFEFWLFHINDQKQPMYKITILKCKKFIKRDKQI